MGGRKPYNNLRGSSQLYEICIQLRNYRQMIMLQRAQSGKELRAEFNFQKQRLQTAAHIPLQSGLSSNKHPYGPRAWDLSLPKLWVTWQISPHTFSKRAEMTRGMEKHAEEVSSSHLPLSPPFLLCCRKGPQMTICS